MVCSIAGIVQRILNRDIVYCQTKSVNTQKTYIWGMISLFQWDSTMLTLTYFKPCKMKIRDGIQRYDICYGFQLHAEATPTHYNDVIMTTMASQITSLTVVYSTVYSDADQRKHQSSASLAFVWGIHRDRWIPRTKASYATNVSIWWRHHVIHIIMPANLCHQLTVAWWGHIATKIGFTLP